MISDQNTHNRWETGLSAGVRSQVVLDVGVRWNLKTGAEIAVTTTPDTQC